jgi:hypothetical protein
VHDRHDPKRSPDSNSKNSTEKQAVFKAVVEWEEKIPPWWICLAALAVI